MPRRLLHQGVGALFPARQAPQLYPVEILLQLIDPGVFAQRDGALDLTPQQRHLVRTVQAVIDASEVNAAFENIHGFAMTVLLLQGQSQAEHLLRQVGGVGAAAGLYPADRLEQGFLHRPVLEGIHTRGKVELIRCDGGGVILLWRLCAGGNLPGRLAGRINLLRYPRVTARQ